MRGRSPAWALALSSLSVQIDLDERAGGLSPAADDDMIGSDDAG